MPADIVFYTTADHIRSSSVMKAMVAGIERCGESVEVEPEVRYQEPRHKVAIFYGFGGNFPKIMADYRSSGRQAVYVDLGYWGRLEGGRLYGYHKISVNDRHPTAYFQNRKHDDLRARKFGLEIKPWRSGKYILLAGMGAKAAMACGYSAEQWELDAIREIRKHTDMPIRYRPKPSWKGARPLPGTEYSNPMKALHKFLDEAHCLVTHHSNAAVDAILEGVPAICIEGVASAISDNDLSKIVDPAKHDNRQQWVNDIAYCQFNIEEMRTGVAWRHLKDEGLVP